MSMSPKETDWMRDAAGESMEILQTAVHGMCVTYHMSPPSSLQLFLQQAILGFLAVDKEAGAKLCQLTLDVVTSMGDPAIKEKRAAAFQELCEKYDLYAADTGDSVQ